MKTKRKVWWGHWGLTFTDKHGDLHGELMFAVGNCGPIDGYQGSPLRQYYEGVCRDWIKNGILPDGATCPLLGWR